MSDLNQKLLQGFVDSPPITPEEAVCLVRIAEAITNWHQVSKSLCGKENATLEEVLQAASQVKAELAAVKRERDAAVTDMRKMAISKFPCDVCSNDHQNDPVCKSHQGDCSVCSVHCPCDGCFDGWEMELTGSNFAWRGVCPENTEVQDGK